MKDLNAKELGDELKKEGSKTRLLIAIFIAALIGLFVLTRFMPHFSEEERDKIFRVPKSPMDLYNITKVLEKYTENYPYYVLFAFVYLYILLQTFAIPGPIFLCILAGPLFGYLPGFFLALSVPNSVIVVLDTWSLLLLLTQLYVGALVGLQLLPQQAYGPQKQAKSSPGRPVLVHAMFEAHTARTELVR
jgi:hypothetical protein